MDAHERECRFYDCLGAAPEVPEGVLREVLRRTRRPGIFIRFAMAACLTLAVGVSALLFVKTGAPTVAGVYGDEDPVNELFFAFEYVNGNHDGEFLITGNQFVP